jgi:hypothetical protein
MRQVPEIVERLAKHRFSAAAAALAAGMPPARLATRLKEGRVPTFVAAPDRAVIGTGGRRTYGLSEIYALRLIEAFASGVGIDVASATAIVDDLRGVGVPQAAPVFSHPQDWWPGEWPEHWLCRDLAAPLFVAAIRTKALGWRAILTGPAVELGHLLIRFPKPPCEALMPAADDMLDCIEGGEVVPPMGLGLVNMTRELAAVDHALGALFDSAGNA